jgi:HAD superfamily hydrolase (TIGR01509 family)
MDTGSEVIAMRWSGVVFDMDGVLVDSEGPLSVIAAAALRDFGVPASAEDFQVFIGMGEDAYIGGVARRHGFAYDLAMKDHVYEKYIEMAPAVVRPFPGAVDLVRSLRARGIPVAVASSADRPKVEANLRALGLGTGDFDAVVTGDDIARKKPDPDIYLEASRRLHVPSTSCVAVEDAASGVRSARAAGMDCIGLATSLAPQVLRDAGATHVAEDIRSAAEEFLHD